MTAQQLVRRWAWVGTFLVGGGLYLLVLAVLTDTNNPNLFPTMILLGALVVPLTFVMFAAGRSGRWLIDGPTLGGSLLFGGVVGVVVAGLLEYDAMRKLGTLPMLGVGLIEEAAKLIVPAVLVVFFGHRYRHSIGTGIIIGVAVGTGFAVLETMGYAFVALLQSGGNVGAAEQSLFIRGLLSPAGHASWTGITCWGLWRFVVEPAGKRFLGFLGLYAVAVALHTAWDGIGGKLTYAIVGVISIGLLLTGLRHAQRQDALPAHAV
ncbi:PrsW family intramembrane metalloprotease [Kribbella sp. CA-293567]|uniref:PrsW family intramembrane metalloprotease n=1 Tax=Kribbella sp. CA-293567 TaxID=3002436 RepID=UPI0022DD776D|nr:PrsW family intramembrane metalloprotease [Kribbella sp. CA-293567]WBQ05414.1 PrsW family intramembrane metalloprotease [Kribbella sp. CA-293567]